MCLQLVAGAGHSLYSMYVRYSCACPLLCQALGSTAGADCLAGAGRLFLEGEYLLPSGRGIMFAPMVQALRRKHMVACVSVVSAALVHLASIVVMLAVAAELHALECRLMQQPHAAPLLKA